MLRYRNEMPDEGMPMPAASASIPKHNYGSHLSLVAIFGPRDKVFYTVVYVQCNLHKYSYTNTV